MGRVIVVTTKVSKTPYYMKESGHPLYSYEELCCYIKNRMPLWMEEKRRLGLTEKMEEWGIELCEMDEFSPYEAAEVIVRAGNYFKDEEITCLLHELKHQDYEEDIYGLKMKADYYQFYGKSRKAYMTYWKAAAKLTGEEDDRWRASLFHNLGMTCCRFFYWEEAERCFVQSLEAADTREARNGLEYAAEMRKKAWDGRSVLTDEQKLKARKQQFRWELD